MEFTAQLPVIGLDLAKSVFQLHIVDMDSGEIQRRQNKRAKLTEFFAKCQKSLVAMEACSSSHYWARTLMSLGHQVKMLPAQHVKAFLLRDKTDAMDAQAIWVAAQQPHILPVPVKTERQQACMALHGMRRQLMKMRIMQTNAHCHRSGEASGQRMNTLRVASRLRRKATRNELTPAPPACPPSASCTWRALKGATFTCRLPTSKGLPVVSIDGRETRIDLVSKNLVLALSSENKY